MNRITLKQWAKRYFDRPPHPDTVRKWRREGKIKPDPILVGRRWYVWSNANYVDRVSDWE